MISIQIRIKDSGIGIEKEDLNKLFKEFGMLKDKRGMNSRGTGLGLNICKNLIEKMGGEVSIESEGKDQGTTFAINLRTEARILLEENKEMIDGIQQMKKVESFIEKKLHESNNKKQKKALKNAKKESNTSLQKVSSFLQLMIKQKSSVVSEMNVTDQIRSLKVLVINDDIFILDVWK